MSDDPEIPNPAIAREETPFAFSYHPAWGFLGVTLGVALLIAVAVAESFYFSDAPGVHIVYAEEGEPIWEGTIPIGVRHVPISEFPALREMVNALTDGGNPARTEEFETIIEAAGIERTEAVICVELNIVTLESLLAHGRLPEPGEHEVLAGIHTRLDSFMLDDQQFTVVGRLTHSAAGLYFAYLIPRDDTTESTFFTHAEATVGWMDLDGRDDLRTLDAAAETRDQLSQFRYRVPTKPVHTLASIMGLAIVAFFGMLAHLSVFRILDSGRCGPLRPALRVFLRHPKTVLSMHMLMYGAFFGMMTFSYTQPIAQMWMSNFIVSQFEQGSVAYIGEAYESGSIPRAAWATFFNNYVIQTVLMTVLISLVLPMIGILKTMLSLIVVGFGMAPTWAGMTGMYTFHSITMTLELEAYIFACICVVFFWGNLVAGAMKNEFLAGLKRSIQVLMSGTLLAGIMLALAALYEAATLILARG